MSNLLDQALAEIRADGDRDCGDLAAATRIRVRRSLEGHARRRHRAVRVGAVLAVLLVTSVSWALSTGRIPLFVKRETPTEAMLVIEPPPLPEPSKMALARRAQPKVALVVSEDAPVLEESSNQAEAEPEVQEAPKPAPPRPAVVAIETLYRKAHALHFHGSDHLATLAAWDEYLAAEPSGRFSLEARYNRALVLIKLERYADARAALAPFATDDGYRRSEAAALVERLDQITR
jgi:hypothetical protein